MALAGLLPLVDQHLVAVYAAAFGLAAVGVFFNPAAGVVGLWLAGNGHPAGWGLGAAAHLLWLPYALAAGQPGFALAVVALGLVCLRNYRIGQWHAGLLWLGRRERRR